MTAYNLGTKLSASEAGGRSCAKIANVASHLLIVSFSFFYSLCRSLQFCRQVISCPFVSAPAARVLALKYQ